MPGTKNGQSEVHLQVTGAKSGQAPFFLHRIASAKWPITDLTLTTLTYTPKLSPPPRDIGPISGSPRKQGNTETLLGRCPAVCADLSHEGVRNSVSAEIMEELAVREGWLAESCTRRKSSPGSLRDAPPAPCSGPPPVASGCCARRRKTSREIGASQSNRGS